jgi:hypothetical protein
MRSDGLLTAPVSQKSEGGGPRSNWWHTARSFLMKQTRKGKTSQNSHTRYTEHAHKIHRTRTQDIVYTGRDGFSDRRGDGSILLKKLIYEMKT